MSDRWPINTTNSDGTTGRQPPSGVCGVVTKLWSDDDVCRIAGDIARRMGDAREAVGLPRDMGSPRIGRAEFRTHVESFIPRKPS